MFVFPSFRSYIYPTIHQHMMYLCRLRFSVSFYFDGNVDIPLPRVLQCNSCYCIATGHGASNSMSMSLLGTCIAQGNEDRYQCLLWDWGSSIACPLTSALNSSSWFKKVACLLFVVTDPDTNHYPCRRAVPFRLTTQHMLDWPLSLRRSFSRRSTPHSALGL